MDLNNHQGKRVAQDGRGKGPKIALITAAVLILLLAGGYTGLCAWVSSGKLIYPNTTVLGADISGMTVQQAGAAVRQALSDRFAGGPLTLVEPSSGLSAALESDSLEPEILDQTLASLAPSGSFLSQGAQFLRHMMSNTTADPLLTFSPAGEAGLAEAIHILSADLAQPMTETVWTLDDDALVLVKGTTGTAIDEQALRQSILDAVSEADGQPMEVTVTLTQSPPPEPDFDAIHQEVFVEPADAYLDAGSKEIIPSVNGVSFDVSAARTALSQAGEGSQLRVPLEITPPALTTGQLEEQLFADVLAQTKSKCAGPSSRWYNIDMAAGFVNGTILLPGEVFSYNALCGPYSEGHGYKKAGSYVQGKTVDTTAGGICQLSSTLYWATLVANLETVERSSHAYNTGYLPIVGTDATVYGDTLDFRFKNNTDFPVKIETYQDKNHWLHVTIYGTNTTGIYGDPYSVRLASIPGEIVYEASSSVPAGSEPKKDPERTLYNGMKVEVHQRLRDKDGNVISDTVIHTDTYRSRNGVYLYNPADAARLGIDPATGKRNLTPVTPTPSPTPTAPVSPTPSPEATPSLPGVVPTPTPTPEPPIIPLVTPTPTPEATPVPSNTPTPPPSDAPVPSESPSETETSPQPTPTPQPTPESPTPEAQETEGI